MRNSPLDKIRKMRLWGLIRQVGQFYKEDENELREYGKQVYENNDVEQSLECFTDLLKQTEKQKVIA